MFKTTKSKIMFVVIFSVICVLVTTLLIIYKNIDTEDEQKEIIEETSQNTKEKDVKGIDLNGTYDQNDIQLEEKKYTTPKVEIQYYEIRGLKNKTIQERINKELEEYGMGLYRDSNMDEIEKITVFMWNPGNYANVASFVTTYIVEKIGEDLENIVEVKGLNYDLTTGEQIPINKLFTSDAPIEDILRKSAYYSFAATNSQMEENLIGEMLIEDYGDIEDKISEFIYLYKKGKITNYSFSENSITIYYKDNNRVTISMEDYAEYIAIYNRYLTTESIYERNDIGIKNIYTLATRYSKSYYYQKYQKGKNYFIDINMYYYPNEEYKDFEKNLVNEKIANIEKEIDKVLTLANRNSEKFYILNYYISVNTFEEWSTKQNLTGYYEKGNSYEVTVHDFEENIEPIIKEYNRREAQGDIPDYLYDFKEVLEIEPQETIEHYNPMTGEKIVI